MSIRRHRRRETDVDLDLTPFMNLMVIMIPSLLINAVFTQVSVLNVDQPGDAAPTSAASAKPTLTLDIAIYPDKFVINNRGQAIIATLQGHDFAQLNTQLIALKRQYPAVTAATLRIDPTVKYQDIISTLDAVRIVQSNDTGRSYALFPEVQLAAVEGAR